jgi:NADP-dependent 3-hydroxy acid dehydrogenase YdfG
VVLASRNIGACEAAAAALRDAGAVAHALPLDLTDGYSIDRPASRAPELVGVIDVLVSNAGLSRPSWVVTTDPATYLAMLHTNLVGAQHLVARLVPAMREVGGGDLVFLSSDVAIGNPRPGMASYTAPKHALEGWVSVLEVEFEGTGVRASIVRPGATATNHADGWDPVEMKVMFDVWNQRGMMPHWNLLQPDDVAAAIEMVHAAPSHVHMKLIELAPSPPVAATVT